jgi:membrane protein YdbS with pleckstrin-like domain
MYCLNCGADIAHGVRFCSSCGAPTAQKLMRGGEVESEETRVAANDQRAPASGQRTGPNDTGAGGAGGYDPEATRLAGGDAKAARVPARSPFDEPRGLPARVEQLGGARESSPAVRPQSAVERQPSGVERQRPAVGRPSAGRGDGADARTEEGERMIFTVRPTMLFVGLGYLLAALGALSLIVLLAVFTSLPATYSVLASLPLLLIPAYYHLRRNSVRYTLTDSKIEIDQGFLSRRTRNIPLRNIQDVTVSATIPQRLLRFGDLIIDNANELGGSTVMRNIPDPRRHADLLLKELRRWN